jgi:hypothetical protein
MGLSPERVAFLLACPKNTKCGGHLAFKRISKDSPDRYIMRSGTKFYFRLHSRVGKDVVKCIGTDIVHARVLRDAMLAEHRAQHAVRLRS